MGSDCIHYAMLDRCHFSIIRVYATHACATNIAIAVITTDVSLCSHILCTHSIFGNISVFSQIRWLPLQHKRGAHAQQG